MKQCSRQYILFRYVANGYPCAWKFDYTFWLAFRYLVLCFQRFQKCDMYRLLEALQIPECYICSQRTFVTGMEALMILLRRLTYPNRWCDLQAMFGRSESELSLILHKVLNLGNRTCLIKQGRSGLVKSPILSNQAHKNLPEYRDWNLLKSHGTCFIMVTYSFYFDYLDTWWYSRQIRSSLGDPRSGLAWSWDFFPSYTWERCTT